MPSDPSKPPPVVLTVGIGTEAAYKQRYPDASDTPALWFDSLSDFARLMSTPNLTLLSMIRKHYPTSVLQLATLAGQNATTVSSTLRLLEQHGLLSLSRGERYNVVADVAFDEIRVLFLLDA
jgi:predicted transcriptional regulator